MNPHQLVATSGIFNLPAKEGRFEVPGKGEIIEPDTYWLMTNFDSAPEIGTAGEAGGPPSKYVFRPIHRSLPEILVDVEGDSYSGGGYDNIYILGNTGRLP